jgi:hypothetical protein
MELLSPFSPLVFWKDGLFYQKTPPTKKKKKEIFFNKEPSLMSSKQENKNAFQKTEICK